jgi:HK97 family phage major capsid protein
VADISRAELSTLIEEAYSATLLQSAAAESVALNAFRRVDMGTRVTNLPVLATLPEASFVAESATDSAGVKPTAEVTWANKQLVAEEIAVIVPIHENAVDDATVDVLEQITIEAGAAIGRKLDAATMFGVDKPASWVSPALYQAAVAANQRVIVGDVEDGEDLAGSILMAAELVDEAGWDPSVVAGPRGLRYRIANVRNVDGTPIFNTTVNGGPSTGSIHGMDAAWVNSRVWNRALAEAFVIDPDRVLVGVRQDISVKFLDQATVGGINLAERDMVALRFKARYAYVLGDNTNAESNSPNVPVAVVGSITSS